MNFGFNKAHMFPALLLAIGLMVGACGNKKETNNTLQSAVKLTYMKGKVLINGEAAIVGSGIQVGDRIVTGAASVAMIQFENHSVMALTEKTDIEISAATPDMPGTDEKPSLSLYQTKGLSFHKVKSGTGYSVRSVTSTAGVRGTMFAFGVANDGKTTVRVLEGKVRVNNAKNKVMLAADKKKLRRVTASTGQMSKSTDLTQEDRKVLRLFNRMPIIPAENLKTLSDSPVNEKLVAKMMKALKIKADAVQADAPSDAQPKTLAGLKKKYGKLSLIITTTGKQYKGAYTPSGTGLTVHTIDGDVSLSGSQISKITPLPDNE